MEECSRTDCQSVLQLTPPTTRQSNFAGTLAQGLQEEAMVAHEVGLVGLGLLGSALAERLLRADFAVLGLDLEPERRELLAKLGGRPAASVREVARACDRLVFSLPDTPAVEGVLEELAGELREGMEIVDTTTGDPGRTAVL